MFKNTVLHSGKSGVGAACTHMRWRRFAASGRRQYALAATPTILLFRYHNETTCNIYHTTNSCCCFDWSIAICAELVGLLAPTVRRVLFAQAAGALSIWVYGLVCMLRSACHTLIKAIHVFSVAPFVEAHGNIKRGLQFTCSLEGLQFTCSLA